jgi:hypothetical protein
MTDARALRRRVTALAMIPAAAGVFGASVAWASSHDPLAQASSSAATTAQTTGAPTAAEPTPAAIDRQAVIDQRLSALNAQIGSAEARIVELQAPPSTAGVAAKAPAKAPAAPAAAAPAAAAPAPAPAAAPAPAPAPAAAPAPAPAPPPPVNVVTNASK